jgi:DNA-binding NarL/FixJ family response regulator
VSRPVDNETVPLRVIVTDDYAPLRALLRELLAPREISVVAEAEDGEQALEVVDQVPCDVVVMDYNMPGINGVETTKRIRERHADLRIVAFTSSTEPHVVEGLLQAGAEAHFSKLDYDGLIDHLVELRLALSGWEPTRDARRRDPEE